MEFLITDIAALHQLSEDSSWIAIDDPDTGETLMAKEGPNEDELFYIGQIHRRIGYNWDLPGLPKFNEMTQDIQYLVYTDTGEYFIGHFRLKEETNEYFAIGDTVHVFFEIDSEVELPAVCEAHVNLNSISWWMKLVQKEA